MVVVAASAAAAASAPRSRQRSSFLPETWKLTTQTAEPGSMTGFVWCAPAGPAATAAAAAA